ncbi:MAG: hypothetical protein ACPGKS_08320 [Coraliomargarita sp.]
MPYSIKWTESGVIWAYTGVLTGEELIESNLAIYSDPRFGTIRYQIVDLRAVMEFQVLQSHMEKVAELDVKASVLNQSIKVAVVTNEVTGKHMNRTYSETVPESHWETKVFNDYLKACDWAKNA